MKKFLTVLLALSVVFTYTVGSAFAAAGVTVKAQADETYTLAQVEESIYAQAQKNVKMLDAVKALYLANYDADSANKAVVNGITLSKTAVETEINNIFNEIANAINKVADDQKTKAVETANDKGTPATYPEYTGEWRTDGSLYVDQKGTAATVENAFDDVKVTVQEFNNIKKKGNLYTVTDGVATIISGTEASFDGSASYKLMKQLYTKTAAVPPHGSTFTKAEKEAYEKAINDEYLKYDTAAEVKGYIDTAAKFAKALLTAEHAVQKAEVVALIDKVDLTKYSSDIPSNADMDSVYYLDASEIGTYFLPTAGYYSYQARVKSVLDKANEELAKQDVTKDDNESDIAEKINKIADADTFFSAYKTVIDKVPTIQEEGWDKEDLETMISRITVAMKSYVAEQKALEQDALTKVIRDLERKEAQGTALTDAEKKTLAESKEKLAALDSEYTAVEKAFENTIKGYDKTTSQTFFNGDGTIKDTAIIAAFKVTDKTLAVAQLAKVAELEAAAELMNNATGVNGKPMYNKDDVATALEAAIKAIYAAKTVADVNKIELKVNPIQDPVKDEMQYVLGLGKIELNKKIYSGVAAWTTTGYDEEKTKEVKSIIEDTKAAIRSAKTVEAVDEAFLAGYTKYDAVPTKTERDAEQTKKAYTDKVAEYELELKLLIDAKAARYGSNFTTDFGINANVLKTKLVGTARNDDGLYAAYTVEDMKTIYDEAVNTVNNLKPVKDLDAELNAINAEITAVKVPVTAEAKDTILALNKKVKEFKKYANLVNYNTTALRTALLETLTDGIKAIDEKEIKDAVEVIMKDGKIALDEKSAVNAVVALVDAYAENYGETAKNILVSGAVKTVYEFDFTDLEVAAVENMIAKIDPTATPLDTEAIKAARDAYDALGEIIISDAMYSKLLSLETLMQEEANLKIIAGVRGTSIKASSVAGKGYIKVNWKKSAGYKVDYYEVFKSDKKSSGYGTKAYFTTKTGGMSNYYKNTKELKKGTRYYFKVRGVRVIDGKKYYTQWSNKAYRIAK